MNVLIIGASKKPDRYAYKAMKKLEEKNHRVFLCNPSETEIEGHSVYASPLEISEPIHTITLYLGPQHLESMIPQIIACKPKRIISNPGTESDLMKKNAQDSGIEYLEACTLVLLSTNQF